MFSRLFFVLLAGIALSGCELAEGIFKAGMAVGVFMVIAVIALVYFSGEQGAPQGLIADYDRNQPHMRAGSFAMFAPAMLLAGVSLAAAQQAAAVPTAAGSAQRTESARRAPAGAARSLSIAGRIRSIPAPRPLSCQPHRCRCRYRASTFPGRTTTRACTRTTCRRPRRLTFHRHREVVARGSLVLERCPTWRRCSSTDITWACGGVRAARTADGRRTPARTTSSCARRATSARLQRDDRAERHRALSRRHAAAALDETGGRSSCAAQHRPPRKASTSFPTATPATSRRPARCRKAAT